MSSYEVESIDISPSEGVYATQDGNVIHVLSTDAEDFEIAWCVCQHCEQTRDTLEEYRAFVRAGFKSFFAEDRHHD